jgi:hypothetical protein
MATLNEASYTAASLLIVSELIRSKDDLRFQLYSLEQISKSRSAHNKLGAVVGAGDDSDEERFVDVDKLEEE